MTSTLPETKKTSELKFVNHPRVHNVRLCPECEYLLFGMPGGRDAVCRNCGYKDPCCTD